jgi:tetratricopeptide (TPR) repeat protein
VRYIRFHIQIGGEIIVTVGRRSLPVLLGIILGVCVVGCGRRSEQAVTCSLTDAPLESYQCELLDVAFGAASVIPSDPHVKSRSQAQAAVVTACLELDQPQRAFRYIEQIEDWRRGMAYADLAFHCVRHGPKTDVEPYLNLATRIAEEAEDWRKDRIRSKVAATRTMSRPADAFDVEMEALAKAASSRQFDAVKEALGAYVQLFNRVYSDAERRGRVEEEIRASWGGVPGFVQLGLLMEMIESSLAHSDRTKTLELVNEAEAIVDSASWQPTIEIPLRARLAGLRFRAGDQERAIEEMKVALELFGAKRDQIVNIHRAQTLRPIAEAYQAMGKTDIANDLYSRAIEAGVENPNSRPRAEDLAATCCSMAVHAVKPAAELLGRIHEIREGLGDPW